MWLNPCGVSEFGERVVGQGVILVGVEDEESEIHPCHLQKWGSWITSTAGTPSHRRTMTPVR